MAEVVWDGRIWYVFGGIDLAALGKLGGCLEWGAWIGGVERLGRRGIIAFGMCLVALGGWGGAMDGRLGIGVGCDRGREL